EARLGRAPRVLEIGCGDLVWHGGSLPANYTGIDLHSRNTWGAHPGATFLVGNAAIDDLPEADIAVARAVFIHLSNRAVAAVVKNVRRAGIPLLLATSRPDADNQNRQPDGVDYSLRGYWA